VPPIEPQYRTTSGTPYCEGYDKYVDIYSQVSYDGGSTWSTTATTPTLIEANSQDCGYVPPAPASGSYLTFEAIDSGTFKLSGSSVSYSLDSGSTWSTLSSNSSSPTVSAGSKIMWKANKSSGSVGRFSSTGRFNVEGNVMSLLYGDNFADKTSLSGRTYVFMNLFRVCTGMTSAENLSLPATTLASSCYANMFFGCTSLTSAPSLPATALTTSCYSYMFYGCTSLTTPPELPATTLASSCYGSMFQSCTSLTTAPSLSATSVTSYCYSYMFRDCTSLTTAPSVLPATNLSGATYCYQYMFYGCSSLTTAPELPATTLEQYCYQGMFEYCTNLTVVPNELPATTMKKNCYANMFNGCSKLTTAPELPAASVSNACYDHMFYNCTKLNYIKCLATYQYSGTSYWVAGVAATGTFVKAASMTSWSTSFDGIPSGWTVQDAT
jgi:hypothetical protein